MTDKTLKFLLITLFSVALVFAVVIMISTIFSGCDSGKIVQAGGGGGDRGGLFGKIFDSIWGGFLNNWKVSLVIPAAAIGWTGRGVRDARARARASGDG